MHPVQPVPFNTLPSSDSSWTASPAARELLALTRDLGEAGGLTGAASLAVTYAVAATGALWAELVEAREGQPLRILAATDADLSRRLYASRSGSGTNPPLPDLEPATDQIVIDDLRSDHRWPNLAALAAADLPVRSAVLQFLAVEGRYAAGLAVYDDRPAYFTEDRRQTLRVLGGFVGIVLAGLAADHQARQLTAALRSNRATATAVGILMNRERLTQDRAFQRLTAVSQATNRKLHDIAEEVVVTGELPLPAEPRSPRSTPVSGPGRTPGSVGAG